MRNIYNAKSYVEEILLGSNRSGLGFINESSHSYFQKSHSFSGYDRNADFSGDILSVGLLNGSILEIGVNSRLANSQGYCECLRNDFCRKTLVPSTYVRIQPKNTYKAQLNLNAGNKIAHRNLAVNSGWGTLGGFLLPQKAGDAMHIVSNNHVLADANRARTGDDIFYMEGNPVKIGNLKNFTAISSSAPNILDLAVAEIPGFTNNGMVGSSSRNAVVGENVYKVGAKTGMSHGVVRSLHYTAKIDFPGFKAVFVDQIQITGSLPGFGFSQPGDSGSLIRSSNDHAFVGLLFAGNDQWTLANHQSNVISKLKEWGYIVK
jgi:hypothetical protein